MNPDSVKRFVSLLNNSGINVLGIDGSFLYVEDPSCIIRSFETFVSYAWTFIYFITGILIFGFAISMIRGAKHDYFMTLRNLVLIFGILSGTGAIMNFIYGDDLFGMGCKKFKVSLQEVNELLELRNLKMSKSNKDDLYENLVIDDTGLDYSLLGSSNNAGTDIENLSRTLENTDDTSATEMEISVSGSSLKNTNQPFSISWPTKATSQGLSVVYTNPDGTKYIKKGGTRAWRNNNPGNIIYGDFAISMGAIGEAGGFAVFPHETTGQSSIERLLKTKNYINLSIKEAIFRYAPPSENNSAQYAQDLAKFTQLSLDRKISDLSKEELTKVANAIRRKEGWKEGTITPIE